MKLTDPYVRSVKPNPDKRLEIPDSVIVGLYLKLQPSGARSWAVRYRHQGRSRNLTIGRYPAVTLAAARDAAREALAEVAKGNDPAAKAKAGAKSFSAVAERFIDRHCRHHQRESTRRATERYLREAGAVWGDWPLDEISRGDVVLLLTRLVDRGSPVSANRLLGNLRSLWNWAIDEGLTETSPCIRVRKRVPELPRDRVLSDNEIRAIWAAWREQGWPSGTFGQLLLTTGQRRLEVAEARWSEFDMDARLWTIPAERMKGGREHVVPLSSLAMELLDGLPRTSSPFLFPGRRGKGAISGFSVLKRRTDAFIREAGYELPAWVFHDLRRTVRSNLSRLGVNADAAEAVLAHTRGGVRGIYDRHSYLREKAEALEAWSSLLRDILDPARKVVVIRR